MFLATGPETTNAIISYGPILVGAGGIIGGIVAAFGRKDKRAESINANLDARTNTALKGLEAALERSDKERDYWQNAAESAEKELVEIREELEALKEEHERFMGEKPPVRKPVKRTSPRRGS